MFEFFCGFVACFLWIKLYQPIKGLFHRSLSKAEQTINEFNKN